MIESNASPLPTEQLPRVALLYCLAALAVDLGLLARELPAWISLVGASAIGWRLLIHRGAASFPDRWTKTLLVGAVCAGLALQYAGGLSLDVYVALLLLGLSLKSLEVYHIGGAQSFLYAAILALMTYLLYAQGFLAVVMTFLQMGLIAAALTAINADPRWLTQRPWLPLKTAAVSVGLAAPLLAFLFVVMPRLPPLWAMPLQTRQARIGMSEDLSPGAFSRPARSAELAFRAGFSGPLPPASELYWRGAVLDTFDGRRWTVECDCHFDWRSSTRQPRPGGPPDYTVVLEPHGHRWVFTLDRARLGDDRIQASGEDLYRYAQPLNERARYEVWPEPAPAYRPLTDAERSRYTRLPANGNPRARELARQWRRQTASDSALIERSLDRFHQSFIYTLDPPLLGTDSVDGFLFDTRRGYCEHYASAFVFLMRAAGLPARIVMGYQGGERHPGEGFISVRQYDAHAWAEVWREGQGWQRVDPTAAVAPERVERGFAEVFPNSPAFNTLLGLPPPGRDSWLGWVGAKLDYLDFLVGRWVLGYDNQRQHSLLDWLGLSTPRGLLLAFGGGLGLTLAAFLLYLRHRDHTHRREDPLTAEYRRLCAAYARLGWPRAPAETPNRYAERLTRASAPAAHRLHELSARYARARYGASLPPTDNAALRRDLRGLRFRLRWML